MTKKQVTWCLVGIMVLAIFFRLWKINSAPPGLFPDEAMNGMNAIETMKTGDYKVFYPDNFGREGLFINIIALSFKVFGVHIWSFRMVSAIFGILTVLGLFFLTKELFDNKTALIASFFLSISFWHVNFSRISFRAIMVPFCLVFGFYFLLRALNLHSELDTKPHQSTNFSIIKNLIISALFFGAGFNTYIAFRITPLIIFSVLAIYFLKKRKTAQKFSLKNLLTKNEWIKIGIFFLVIFLAVLPLLIHFYQVPADFSGRTAEVSIMSAKEGPILALIKNTVITHTMFNIWGDGNWRHNYAHWPMLSIPVGILFLIGLFLTAKQFFYDIFKQKKLPRVRDTLLLVWFEAMLLPAILTNEGLPHALRTIGTIPVACIFAAIGFMWVVEKIAGLDLAICFVNSQKKLSCLQINTIITIFIVIMIPMQYYKYFHKWAKNPKTAEAFTQYLQNTGKCINDQPKNSLNLVVIKHPLPDQSIRFFTYNKENVKYFWDSEGDRIQLDNTIRDFRKNNLKNNLAKPRINIYTTEHYSQFFLDLLEKYPKGIIEKKEGFWFFRLY